MTPSQRFEVLLFGSLDRLTREGDVDSPPSPEGSGRSAPFAPTPQKTAMDSTMYLEQAISNACSFGTKLGPYEIESLLGGAWMRCVSRPRHLP